MSPETIEALRDRPRRKVPTSVNLKPEEHEMLIRLSNGLGVSRSKAMGLAVRRYAVEMGLGSEAGEAGEARNTPACSASEADAP
jgi:hypothetical protein